MEKMSESSYGSTQDEVVAPVQPETKTTSTQVDFATYQLSTQKQKRLHRHHTTSELFDQKHGVPRSRFSAPPKYRVDPSLNRCDSGLGSYSTTRFRHSRRGGFYGDSPTLSLTPPNSLDYICLRSEYGSSVPSIQSAAMNNPNKTNGGIYLSPNYLQYPKFNQSSGDLQAAIAGSGVGPGAVSGASSCRCSCRCGDADMPSIPPVPMAPPKPSLVNRTTAEGLSWRRLHMSRAKLKATATTSELLSGFAMVAMVELQINEPTNVPEWLFVMFAVCTTVLVAVHIFALMISTYLLPTIDAVSKIGDSYASSAPQGGGGAHPGQGGAFYTDGSQAALHVIRESPHERMRGFIELAWAFSTVLGLFLFLVEIAILCWVKFWDYSFAAATAATVIVIPVLIVFVAFAVHFYHSLVVHKCDTSEEDMEQLESMKRDLDSATLNAGSPV